MPVSICLGSVHVSGSLLPNILMAEITKIQGSEDAVVEYVSKSDLIFILLTC